MIPPSQSNVYTGGGDMIGVVIGGSRNQAHGSRPVVQPQDAGMPVTLDQVIERLAELERAVQGSTLPDELRRDTLSDVRTACDALSRDQPGIVRARRTLGGTLEELKTGGHTEAFTALAPLVTAVLEMLGRLAG